MSKYTPQIDPESGEVIFPPIKQDDTDVYIHNVLQTMDELNTEKANQPTILLSIATNDSTELELDQELSDLHYSHKLIKKLSSNQRYIPTDLAAVRDDRTYGNTTLIHLHNNRQENEKYLYEHNLQTTMLLSDVYKKYPPTD